jgi:hypothetical protein
MSGYDICQAHLEELCQPMKGVDVGAAAGRTGLRWLEEGVHLHLVEPAGCRLCKAERKV